MHSIFARSPTTTQVRLPRLHQLDRGGLQLLRGRGLDAACT